MRRPRGRPDPARVVAAVVVLLVHLGIYQVLVRGPQGMPVQAPGSLRVEFIDRPPLDDAAADTPGVPAAPGPPRRSFVSPPDMPDDASGDSAPAPVAEPLRLQWREGNGFDTPPAPRGGAALPIDGIDATPPGRFAMREPVKGKDVIEGTAKALGLWPEGYTTDPCPRIRQNIGERMTDTRPEGRRALEEELRRRRVACGR